MSYQVLQDSIHAKIQVLGNQLNDWVKKLNLKNVFELSHFPFEDAKERSIVHGMIQRRDAYVDIGNMIELEQTSLSAAREDSKSGVVSSVETMKIIGNAFSREVESKLLSDWIANPKFITAMVNNEANAEDCLRYSVNEREYDEAITVLAVLWYNKFKEAVIPPVVVTTPEPEQV